MRFTHRQKTWFRIIGSAKVSRSGKRYAQSCREAPSVLPTFHPIIIVAEPTELIGTGQTSDEQYVVEATGTIKSINPEMLILLTGPNLRTEKGLPDSDYWKVNGVFKDRKLCNQTDYIAFVFCYTI